MEPHSHDAGGRGGAELRVELRAGRRAGARHRPGVAQQIGARQARRLHRRMAGAREDHEAVGEEPFLDHVLDRGRIAQRTDDDVDVALLSPDSSSG